MRSHLDKRVILHMEHIVVVVGEAGHRGVWVKDCGHDHDGRVGNDGGNDDEKIDVEMDSVGSWLTSRSRSFEL